MEDQKIAENSLPNWKFVKPLANRGVLIASDSKLEWMLPWWWNHYRKYNDFPLSIVDFGMTKNARKWCEKIGTVYDFDYSEPFVYGKDLVSEKVKKFLKERIFVKNIWDVRKLWFQTPLAMLQTPYQTTIWLDIDCEILGSLEDLFEKHDKQTGISMVEEDQLSTNNRIKDGLLEPGDIMYNGGVIVYEHGTPLMIMWANEILVRNHLYSGNQDCLCHVIRENGYAVNPLPNIYNWRMKHGPNPNAKIIHWVSDAGKRHILNTWNF
jgi:hypothetical protein